MNWIERLNRGNMVIKFTDNGKNEQEREKDRSLPGYLTTMSMFGKQMSFLNI